MSVCPVDETQATASEARLSEQEHDPLDPATFKPPAVLPTPTVTIEFCDRVSTDIQRQI